MSDAGFRLSRIHAEGWKKAQELSAVESEDMDLTRAAELNPYRSEPERSRWNAGFEKGIWG
jgi:hypothetical protein